MNEIPPQHIIVGLDVTYIGLDNKPHQAKITEVFNQLTVRVESLDNQNTAIADYSETGEVNTFSFPSSANASAKAEKKEEAHKKEK